MSKVTFSGGTESFRQSAKFGAISDAFHGAKEWLSINKPGLSRTIEDFVPMKDIENKYVKPAEKWAQEKAPKLYDEASDTVKKLKQRALDAQRDAIQDSYRQEKKNKLTKKLAIGAAIAIPGAYAINKLRSNGESPYNGSRPSNATYNY